MINIFYNKKIVALREEINKTINDASFDLNSIFFKKILDNPIRPLKILDIGTGNGFILSKLYDMDKQCYLYGIDNSQEMVHKCTTLKEKGINISLASNYDIPFEEDCFDVVTAKNVTRFDASEIYRVLKKEGVFVYREYCIGKGLIEIATLFKERLIRARDIDYYTKNLEEAGITIKSVEKYLIKRNFKNVDEIIKVIKSFPMIENFSIEDEEVIRENFTANSNIEITSDPFIIVGKKEKVLTPVRGGN